MQDFMNTILLICATMGSLALGVLLAYVVCTATFSALKMHARSLMDTPQPKTQVARVS